MTKVAAAYGFLLRLATPAIETEDVQKSARLIEVKTMARCNGLDCPPWHVPPSYYFCFDAAGESVLGESSPAFGTKKQEALAAMVGEPIELRISKKSVRVKNLRLDLKLKRTSWSAIFDSPACRKQ